MGKICFIGAGNMGGALVRGVCKGTAPDNVVIFRRNRPAAAALAAETGCTAAESAGSAVRDADYVVLCVKPQVLPAVVEELLPALSAAAARGQRQVLVSIAAGIPLSHLRALTAAIPGLPIIRVMPNTPVAVGKGLLLVSADGAGEEDLAGLSRAFAPCGMIERVSEQELDMGSAIAGCGPAFVYLFLEALADGGVEIGLSREKAQTWAAQMAAGAAEMVLRSGQHPGALKDAVCSPGGSTIAGVAALEKNAFRSAAAQAVKAAYEKNCRLAGQ